MRVLRQIPSVPLKDVRSIFENLSHIALTDQQQLTPRKPSKWDKPHGSATTADTSTNIASSEAPPLHHGTANHQTTSSEDVEAEHASVVHGSSTVFLVDNELPPPAFTRNIVAKFRQLEAATGRADKTVPMPPTTAATSRSPYSSHGNAVTSQTTQHASPTTDVDDVADGCLVSKTSSDAQNADERGRTVKRSEAPHQRPSSASPAAANDQSPGNELPQEGELSARITATVSLLAYVKVTRNLS